MSSDRARAFSDSDRPDIMLVTNHGYAGVELPIGGAADTGGQNVYVNALARALDALGYRVTIIARGGFPYFGKQTMREAPEYLTDHVRYVFVPGGGDEFIRKEDIAVALDEEVEWLDDFIQKEAAQRGVPPWRVYELVNTHYWDAAVIGVRLVERWRDRATFDLIAEACAGVVAESFLARERERMHQEALGATLRHHLGRILMEGAGTAGASILERAIAAAARWAEANDGPDDLPQRVEQSASKAAGDVAPALATVFQARALGTAVLSVWDPGGEQVSRALDDVDRHVWTPHSLSAIKETNFRDKPLEVQRNLKFCERRNHERAVCDATRSFAATSTEIAERLHTHNGVPLEQLFYFPPCVEEVFFRSYDEQRLTQSYAYLSGASGVPADELRQGRVVFETSRMDGTKRKDVLLDAFARAAADLDDTYLFIGGGPKNATFEALGARREADPVLRKRAFLLGYIPEEEIHPLFALADVFCTPSEMEGFGMSIAQAAAAGTAVVSSDLVPFATQYVPDAALIAPAGDVEAFAGALRVLLTDAAERVRRGETLARIARTLDWLEVTRAFLNHLRRSGFAVAEGRVDR